MAQQIPYPLMQLAARQTRAVISNCIADLILNPHYRMSEFIDPCGYPSRYPPAAAAAQHRARACVTDVSSSHTLPAIDGGPVV